MPPALLATAALAYLVPSTRLVGMLQGAVLGVFLAYAVEMVFLVPGPSAIVPATVLLAWLAAGLTRKWQSEPSWIDRAGRLVGVLWLATIPVYFTGFVWLHLK